MSTKVKIAIALIAGLLIAGISPATAALTEEKTIESLPYSDSLDVRSTGFFDGGYDEPSGISKTTSYLGIGFLHVENIENIDYASGYTTYPYLISKFKSYWPEGGYYEVWYKRPSDDSLQPATLQIIYSKNFLGQTTKASAYFYPANWETGSKSGKYFSYIYTDSAGTIKREMSTNWFAGSSLSPKTTSGDEKYCGGVWLACSTSNIGSDMKNMYSTVSTYSDAKYNLNLDAIGSDSIRIKITRDINQKTYFSYIEVRDPSDSMTFSDYSDKNIDLNTLKSKVSRINVTCSDHTRIYLIGGSGGDPSPEPNDQFTLSLTEEVTTNYDTVTATLTSAAGAPEWDEIAWIHGGDEQRTFRLAGDAWQEFNYESLEYDIPSDEHAALNYQFQAYCPPGGGDEDIVLCCLYSGGHKIAELTGRVAIVAGSSKTQLAVVVIDYSGGSTPILFGADVSVQDQISKQFQTESGSDDTFHRFVVEKGRRYTVSAEADGFHPSSREITASRDIQTIEIYLSQNASVSVPENSTQVDFLVKDPQNNGVEGALISLTDSQTSQTQTGLTNSFGTRTFVVEKGHLYQYTVSKTGYVGMRGTVDPSIPGTRTIVICSEDAWPGAPDQPVSPGSGPDPDHHEMARQTLNEASEFVPHLFSFALLMLFLCVMRRGGK